MNKTTIAMVAALGTAWTVQADYATSGDTHYTSTTSDLAAVFGETPTGPYTWTHTGKFFMYAGGLIPSLEAAESVTPAALVLQDATVKVTDSFTVASGGTVDGAAVGGSGSLVLDNTRMTVDGDFNVDNQNVLGGSKPNLPVLGRLTLRNDSTLTVGKKFNLSANAAKGAEWNASLTNEVVLSSGSTLSIGSEICRYDGPSGRFVFDGGKIVNRSTSGFFGAYGYGYDGKSAFVVTNTPGQAVVLESSYSNMLMQAQNTGYVMVDGPVHKLGRGVLVLNGPSSNSGYVDRLAFNGLTVDAGEVLLYNSFTFRSPEQFPKARRGTVTLAAGARLNLNNNDSVIESLAGAGTVYASGRANLTLWTGTDVSSTVKLGAGLKDIVKRETGRAELAPFGLAADSLTVSGGTLKLVDPEKKVPGYTHYRFRVLKVNDETNANQIMELREVKLFEGEADVTYAAEFRYDNETTQTGGTAKFGNNELPEKAIDMSLTTKWCDLRYADQDCWWVEFVYTTPVQVTGYNWAKTDNLYRSPREWVLEGSDDGVNWTELSHERVDTRNLASNQWVSETPFAVSTTIAQARTEKLGALTVAAGATLDLSGLSASVEATPADLQGSVAVPAGGALILNCAADMAVSAAVFSGTGTLVKTGAGKLTILGALAAGLATEVREGTLDFAAASFAGKFFRFTIKDIRDTAKTGENSGTVMNLGKLYLYDAGGNVVNEGLTWRGGNPAGGNANTDWKNSEDGTPAKDLAPGTFSQAGQYRYSIWNNAHEAPYWIFYPATDTHKWCTTQHAFYPDDASTWYTINFRLKDDAQPVVSYNLRAIGNLYREVSAWSLEGSVDGETWVALDEKSLGADTPTGAHQWYNNGKPYLLDLTQSAADIPPVAKLTVDCAAVSVGTLAAFNPAANGLLQLTHVGTTEIVGQPLPLAVTTLVDGGAQALKTWMVTVDGEVNPKLRVVVKNGRLVVEQQSGFVIMIW